MVVSVPFSPNEGKLFNEGWRSSLIVFRLNVRIITKMKKTFTEATTCTICDIYTSSFTINGEKMKKNVHNYTH